MVVAFTQFEKKAINDLIFLNVNGKDGLFDVKNSSFRTKFRSPLMERAYQKYQKQLREERR